VARTPAGVRADKRPNWATIRPRFHRLNARAGSYTSFHGATIQQPIDAVPLRVAQDRRLPAVVAEVTEAPAVAVTEVAVGAATEVDVTTEVLAAMESAV